jgi:hypothetical protein
MCVQYSLNRLLKGLAPEIALTRMMYSEREPVLLDDKSLSADRARLSLSSKTVRWSNEREWRIFRPESGQANYGPEKVVTKVFLGSRISDKDEAAVRQEAKVLGVPVVKMKVSAYQMSFE